MTYTHVLIHLVPMGRNKFIAEFSNKEQAERCKKYMNKKYPKESYVVETKAIYDVFEEFIGKWES